MERNLTDKASQILDLFDVSCPESDLSAFFSDAKVSRSQPEKVCFFLTLEGNALVEIDGMTWRMQPNMFIYLTPRHTMRLITRSDNFCYRYIGFDFDFISDFPLLLKPEVSEIASDIPGLSIDNRTHEMLQQYYNLIYSRFHDNENKMRMEVTKGLLFSFITEISQLYSNLDKSTHTLRQGKLADRFFTLLHKHYKQEHSALFYANKLYVSDKHLMRVVKEQTGHTIHYWITGFILREAKLLLKSTDKNVTEISDELKFSNSSFFARFFRKHTKMSPSEFRKSGNQ